MQPEHKMTLTLWVEGGAGAVDIVEKRFTVPVGSFVSQANFCFSEMDMLIDLFALQRGVNRFFVKRSLSEDL
jgi:hypothetical protein